MQDREKKQCSLVLATHMVPRRTNPTDTHQALSGLHGALSAVFPIINFTKLITKIFEFRSVGDIDVSSFNGRNVRDIHVSPFNNSITIRLILRK